MKEVFLANIIIPPLAIHFIWHSDDNEQYFPFIKKFREYLTRDLDRPFSRELNIPTFLYSSKNTKTIPNQVKKLAEKDLVFLFLSKNTLINPDWSTYINTISDEYLIIPIALDSDALNHSNNTSSRINQRNFVRAFSWPLDLYQEYMILMLSHEIFRFSFNDILNEKNKGIDLSLKVFLSHAKQDEQGVGLAKEIKNFIDNTSIQRFFDATDIAPGFDFENEITEHLKESTVIAIGSDKYSSRYWCQREILTAKEQRRPIIFVDTLEFYEDRIFPAAVNIPNIHLSHDNSLREKEILRVLIATLLETIRFNYSKKLLKYYQEQEWIHKDAEIFARPPEVNQVIKLLKEKKKKGDSFEILHICYPEPAVYPEEIEWINYFENKISSESECEIENRVQAVTPLWSIFEEQQEPKRIGISISDYREDQFESHNQHLDELKRLSQVIAGHLLARKHTLIYGGDLRDDGFTQFILDEALIVQSRLKDNDIKVENHLAWPIYLGENIINFKAKYHRVLFTKEYSIPDDIYQNKDVFLSPSCPDNKYIWSRCLTTMRNESIKSSDYRIFAGGKCESYLGKMPGVLEEFILSIEENKPVYLLGGFGGITSKISNSIINNSIEDELTLKWQIENNGQYADLQEIAGKNNHNANYDNIKEIILSLSIEKLCKGTGLDIDEYSRLMRTPFIDEAVHLILKGLKR